MYAIIETGGKQIKVEVGRSARILRVRVGVSGRKERVSHIGDHGALDTHDVPGELKRPLGLLLRRRPLEFPGNNFLQLSGA